MTWSLLLVECVVQGVHFVQISFFFFILFSGNKSISCISWEGSMVFMFSHSPVM